MPDRKDEIERKYSSAFDEMRSRQVNVVETEMHDDKLYVLAWAPSDEDKNRVWDRIKEIDPSYSDLICDIRITGKDPSPEQVQRQFDQVAQSKGALAGGLAEAFRSRQTASFGSMLSRLFQHSDPNQRAGLLNSLFSVTPSSVASEVFGMFGGKKQLTPEEAQRVPPEAVQRLANQAEKSNPSIVDKVSEFYADHPGVVKTLGIGALTVAVSKIAGGLRKGSGGS